MHTMIYKNSFARISTASLLIFSLLATPSLWAQNAAQPNGQNYIVAVVDAEPITNVDVALRATQLRQQLTQQGKVVPASSQLLQDALNKLIDEKALLQFAKETGTTIDDEAVNQAEQRVAAQRQISVEALHKKLLSEGSSPTRLRQELRDQLTLQRLTERNVPSRIRISDVEVEQAIRARKNAFVDPNPDVELGQIFIAVPEKSSAEQVQELQAKAQQALSKLKQGESFATVAKAFSDGAERDKDGLMSARPLDRYPTLFSDTVQNFQIGEVSSVIRSGAGFHILKLVSKKGKQQVTVTETRARHILLRPGGKLSQTAARGQLAEYKRQIESGKVDFADLAKAHSQDGSAANGGDLGWVTSGTFVPEFEEAMNKLKPGEIADPVVSRFGVHLIQLLARREAPISEKDLRELVRNQLRTEKFDETYQMWVQEVRGRAYVELREPPQ
jgi:peptidyl-prolyl cis-trans isomerase SurA